MKSRNQIIKKSDRLQMLENKIRKMVKDELLENTNPQSVELKNVTNKLLKLLVANDVIHSNLREKTIVNLKAIQQVLTTK